MMLKEFKCAHCGKTSTKEAGAINRAVSAGMSLYCDRACSGLGRRKGKTKEQKVAEKAAYDAEYRARNREMLKAKKAEYFQRTYDPVKAAEHRKTRMAQHVEYCRQPEYREWKRGYDRKYRADKMYGPFADAFLALLDLEQEVTNRATRYEIYMERGTINKTLRRKREYAKAISG